MFIWIAPLVAAIPLLLQASPASLALSLECRGSTQAIEELLMTLRNPGPQDTAVLLGLALANGQKYALQDLILVVKRTGGREVAEVPEVEEYRYRARDYPTDIAGKMDHWILPLPAASAFTMVLSSVDFLSTRTLQRPTAIPQPAEVSVRLLGKPVTYDLNPAMAGLRNLRMWSGEAVSTTIRVPDDCRK